MSCPDCFRGQVHQGDPKGKVIKLCGLDTYVSEPPNDTPPKGIIVIIPDAFGWEFVNNRILADHYAEKGGFTIYLPDFMNGHAAPISMLLNLQTALSPGNIFTRFFSLVQVICSFVPFYLRCSAGKSYPAVKGFFEQLRKEQGQSQFIGAAGFCWGGKHTVTLAHGAEIDGQLLIDAGFTGHPSMLKIPADIERIKRPLSFACPEQDNQISLKQAEQIKAIVTAFPESYRGELQVYEKTGHGFCVRADIKNEDVAAQASAAEDQAIAWFTSHFKNPS